MVPRQCSSTWLPAAETLITSASELTACAACGALQHIMLLSALGIPAASFLELQQQYLEELASLPCDAGLGIAYLMTEGRLQEAEHLAAADGIDGSVRQALLSIQAREISAFAKPRQQPASQGSTQAAGAPRASAQASSGWRGASSSQEGPGTGAQSSGGGSSRGPSGAAGDARAQGSPCSAGSDSQRERPPDDEEPAADADASWKLRLRIRVAKSRVVFGVADPTGLLSPGCVFFQPLVDGQPTAFVDTQLLMVRCSLAVLHLAY